MSEELHETTNASEVIESVDTQETKDTLVEEKKERTFTRAEFAKALSAERSKWEAEQAQVIEAAKSEGERLAKLSKDQRAKEEEEQRLAALEKREQAIAMKELRLETQSILVEEGMPVEFLDIVLDNTAEKVKENISNIRSVFDKEVERRVNERLVQKAPRLGNSSKSWTKEEIVAVEDSAVRERLISENINLFKR